MATFDATKNFAKAIVSTGYDAAATSIVLASGKGSLFPEPSTDGEYNFVWWNSTDYGDPTDDPNKEVGRCTTRVTDTLTIVRAQEGTSATIKNIAGKTYRIALSITAKVVDDITDEIDLNTTHRSSDGSDHTFIDQSVIDGSSPNFDEPTSDSLTLDLTADPAYAAGKIKWVTAVDTPVIDLNETGVHAPLVAETFKVKNISGGIITSLTVVYPTGSTGGNPTVDLADASDFDKSRPVGVIRSTSIADQAVGYVTLEGRMCNLDTSAFAEGAKLYLSTTPGEVTATKPAYPNHPVRVAVVTVSHATEGVIIVDSDPEHDIDQALKIGSTPSFNITDTNSKFVATTFDGAFDEVAETKFTNGYDLQTATSLPDLAWDDGTRTFSASVAGGSSDFYFWVNGRKVIKTTTQTVVIPDTTGLYYTYFDNSGVLQYISVASVPDAAFYEYAITGMVRWNATQGSGGAADERHGVRMSASTHKYNHDTFGARYASGFDPVGLTDTGSTFTQVNSGKFWDEDIEHSVAALTTQPWLYRLGATGEWTVQTADNEVGLFESGDTYYSWNEWTGSTWQLTEGGVNTDFFITFVIATPNIGAAGVIKVPGHNAYANITDARNAIESERENLDMGDLVSPELVFLYALIVKRDGTLQALSDGSTYYDLRISRGGGGGASLMPTEAEDLPTDTTNFDGILSTADTNVQLALDTIDDHTHDGRYYTETEIDTWRNGTTQTEMGYVHGVTSDIQTQFDAKAPIADPTFTGEIGIGAVNVSETELGILEGATLTTTELNYVDGVTSDIQTQIDTKAPIADPTFTGEIGIGAVNVSETELGILEGATLTTVELNYVDGVTSAIQTQLDTKLANVSEDTTPQLGGELDAVAHSIGFTLQTATGDGTTTIDWKLGNKFKFTFGAFNETFTFTAPTKPGTFMLTLVQDATGSRTVTWPATVKWAGGVAPTLSTTASARDKVALDWDGTQYDATVSLNFS